MPYDLKRTNTPGIYKRGDRYVVTWRDRGTQHRESFRTMAEAREAQGKRRQRSERKAFSRMTFAEYATDWLSTYTGRTQGGLTDSTRAGYRRAIERWAIPYLGDLRMCDIGRRDIRGFVKYMQDHGVRAASMRAHIVPLKALFATALDDEDIGTNPVPAKLGVAPQQPGVARAMTREELGVVLAAMPDRWRTFFAFLAQTGLRISEAVALTWEDLDLGTQPIVKVRRQNYRGKVTRLKTKYSVRNVPLSPEMAEALRKRRAQHYHEGGPVFCSLRGGPLDSPNLRNRVLRPVVKELGLPWVGYHSFRHTCASMLFANGKNAKQVQRWLGHADPGFTLRVYVHLMDEGLGGADFAPMLSVQADNAVTTQHP